MFRGLGFLALFLAPICDGSYFVPLWANVWIQGCLDAMTTANINDCVHGGKAVPEPLLTPVTPADHHGSFFTCSDGDWLPCEAGRSTDLTTSFCRRVVAIKKAQS